MGHLAFVVKVSYAAPKSELFTLGQVVALMDMQVVETEAGLTHIVLDGRMDVAGAQAVDLKFSVLAGSRKKIVVDMAKVSFLASMGLRTLMFSAKTVAKKGGDMVICGADENVEKVLRMSGVDEVIRIFPDFEAAASALSA